MHHLFMTAIVLGLGLATVAQAQTTGTEVQRDINQQNRIERGLQSGQLNTKEAGRLGRAEARIDRMESNAMKDGTLSSQEADRINRAQNQQSQQINEMKHNAVTGNPNSASSQRMQTDVQRNANQEQRIQQGMQSGSLTTQEAGALEKGQARTNRKQAKAAADGHVGAREQARIQNRENRQSARIYNKKHNDTIR
jgi:hypothetical protein